MEWIRDVINEDGFAETVGDIEAGEIRDNFDNDFPAMEYAGDGYECSCGEGWYPQGQLPDGYGPVIPGVPIVSVNPVGPFLWPGFPTFTPSPAPIPAFA